MSAKADRKMGNLGNVYICEQNRCAERTLHDSLSMYPQKIVSFVFPRILMFQN